MCAGFIGIIVGGRLDLNEWIMTALAILITVLESIPMYWVILVTYNEKSIILKMMRNIENIKESFKNTQVLKRTLESSENMVDYKEMKEISKSSSEYKINLSLSNENVNESTTNNDQDKFDDSTTNNSQ